MESFERFEPERRRGVLVHAGAALVLLAVGIALFWLAMQQNIGAYFVLFLVLALIILAIMPLVAYRSYALLTAYYAINRDLLRIRWGLRVVDLPLAEVEWIRPLAELGYALPAPRLGFTGAYLGTVKSPELGEVEYLAADHAHMIVIAATQKVYIISPTDITGFYRAIQKAMEMGSLAVVKGYSVQPGTYLLKVWENRLARMLILAGFGISVMLFVLVSLLAPTQATISLGFSAQGIPLESVPTERLLLLPILNFMVFLADLVMGLYLFRRQDSYILAIILWAGSILTGVMLIVSVIVILIFT